MKKLILGLWLSAFTLVTFATPTHCPENSEQASNWQHYPGQLPQYNQFVQATWQAGTVYCTYQGTQLPYAMVYYSGITQPTVSNNSPWQPQSTNRTKLICMPPLTACTFQ